MWNIVMELGLYYTGRMMINLRQHNSKAFDRIIYNISLFCKYDFDKF